MISGIRVDGQKLALAPNAQTLNVRVVSFGDEVSFSVEHSALVTNFLNAVSLALQKIEEAKDAPDVKPTGKRPAAKKKQSASKMNNVYVGGKDGVTLLNAVKKELKLIAPQYMSAINFMIKRHRTFAEKLKMVKLAGHHYVEFDVSIAVGTKAR